MIADKLAHWVERNPLVLLNFPNGFNKTLRETKNGFERFTFSTPHENVDGLKLPTLCLVEMSDRNYSQCYIGVIQSKAAITTFDSRLTILKLRELNLTSFEMLCTKISETRFKTALQDKQKNGIFPAALTPKLSSHIVAMLASDEANKAALDVAEFHLPNLRKISNPEWEQLDAIQMALAAFGIGKAATPDSIELRKDSSSTLSYLGANLLEDNVIGRDASVIPGFSLIEKAVTGRAVFRNNENRLEVYTANRGPLEEMLGVDLIYVNATLGNIVMVQYKMLEAVSPEDDQRSDWVYRPDNQYQIETSRMRLPPILETIDDYRLNRSPFYFKFVKRKDGGRSPQSFIISFDHLEQLFRSPQAKGPRGGVRLSYGSLKGTYLRESDFIGLIRSGYIGTHKVESSALNPIISKVAEGNRALVLAWQTQIQQVSE